MKIKLAHTLRNYDKRNLAKDILAGVIIAAVSIPISMGYAQIAGLPAQYGLYGSVFPIIVFALLTTSPQFIFGVDAAPAALVGAALISLGIENESAEALTVVPLITLMVAAWLLLFHFLKAGRMVNYISSPVMGGFITGICMTIILMQIPKLLGGTAGVGELVELAEHLYHSLHHINIPSLVLGLSSLLILIACKKFIPKFPMAVVLMALGAALGIACPVKEWGINTLSSVDRGLPAWKLPVISIDTMSSLFAVSLSVAVVIMAETLLAENNLAQKNGYRIDDNQELLAFSMGNLVAALTGCCPINGSVSRSAMGEQYQAKTQLTSLVAGLSMIAVLLFATGFIGYLPVPVLTAIVISALMGATEFHLAAKLWNLNRKEFLIFAGAFLGVLIFGTINGVLIGIVLSFAEMILRTSRPATCFLGTAEGKGDFRNLAESDQLHPIEGVVIYRFSSGLFFANIGVLQSDIESSIEEDTKAVIVDASGITSIDVTAAERIEALYHMLKNQGIAFYMVGHIADLNVQLRKLGLTSMLEEGAIRMSIEIALRDLGLRRPYPLKGGEKHQKVSHARRELNSRMQEFTWAFGDQAEYYIEKQIHLQIENLKKTGDIDRLFHGRWHYKNEFDEDFWLEHLEEHLKEIVRISGKNESSLAAAIEDNRRRVLDRIRAEHPELADRFLERRHRLDEHLRQTRPDVYEYIITRRNSK